VEAAEARRSLAQSLHRPEDLHRATELLRQALATLRQRLGDGHLETAETLSELGGKLEEEQQYGEAEKAYREALARLEFALGPHHPRVALVQGDLAGLLDRLSRPAEARKLFEAAIATQRAVLGPRHQDLGGTLFSYGLLLEGRQELKAADAALAEALGIFGTDRYEGGYCLRYLGLSAMDQERFEDAAALFTRAADTLGRTMGPDDVERWRTIANLGWAHLKLKRIPLARQELSQAVASIERVAGPESYALRLPLKELGETLTKAGAAGEAIATLERLHRLEGKLFGTFQHTDVAGSELLLAEALLARGAAGDRQAARRTLDEAIATFTRLQPKDLLFGKVLLESGKLALAEGDRARARRELMAAEQILLTHVPPTHEKVREARRLLAAAGG
jgi:tetratricopeptide (TPR) repeat protein